MRERTAHYAPACLPHSVWLSSSLLHLAGFEKLLYADSSSLACLELRGAEVLGSLWAVGPALLRGSYFPSLNRSAFWSLLISWFLEAATQKVQVASWCWVQWARGWAWDWTDSNILLLHQLSRFFSSFLKDFGRSLFQKSFVIEL